MFTRFSPQTLWAALSLILYFVLATPPVSYADLYDNDGSLDYTWEAGSGLVDHYNIYVSLNDGGFELFDTTADATSAYTLEDAVDGGIYRLKVQAVDAFGNTSPKSESSDPVTVDMTAPTLTDVTASPVQIQNGETLTLMVRSEPGLSVSADVSVIDSNSPSPLPLVGSDTEAGTYIGSILISENNTVTNGPKTIVVTAKDLAGNTAQASAEVTLDNPLTDPQLFNLSIPKGFSLIHIPLKVTAINNHEMEILTIGDLYNALGGAKNVSFIITSEPPKNGDPSAWHNLSGNISRGSLADRVITDDMGMGIKMKNPVNGQLKGEALGHNGTSQITLNPGRNLIGIPLNDERLKRVSDLFSLEGFKDNVTSITVFDQGQLKKVTKPGDDGDIDISGGQAFGVIANNQAVVEINGVAWDNVSSSVAAPPILAVDNNLGDGKTPVLAVYGYVIDEQGDDIRAQTKSGAEFRITVDNLSTGETLRTFLSASNPLESGEFNVTFVDLIKSRAAQVGDILSITVQTPSPLIRVQPLRHIVEADEVNASMIRLPHLIAYEVPTETKLLFNYPNPFNPETWIPFQIAQDSFVTLTIYNIKGEMVRTIEVGHRPAAVYRSKEKAIYFDGRNSYGEHVASGVYFYSLTANTFTETRKMVILK